jgi:O-antigen ligase
MPDATPKTDTPSRPDPLARAVLVHFGVLLLVITWAFGGQAPLARQFIAWWGTLGIILFVVASVLRRNPGELPPALRLLWPLWLFDALVIASCFNPGFRELASVDGAALVMRDPVTWLPTAAVPRLAARELWQLNGLVLSSASLFVVLRRRGQIRSLLYLIAGNAVVLAVLGTFQQLIRSDGLWFGLVKSPNNHFFSTFIYHNHWGAFALMSIAVCLALLFHHYRQGSHRGDTLHSPVLLGAVLTLLLAISIPLSTSRSSTVLAAVFLTVALGHLIVTVVRRRPNLVLGRVAGILLAAVLAVGAIGFLGRHVIAQRLHLTSTQLNRLAEEGTLTSRWVLYTDTWHMAAEKPWFGWGLESYGRVFPLFNTQRPVEPWFPTPVYREAHNDWLQALAEVGFVGTGLLVLQAVVPLLVVPWRRVRAVIPFYLLAGTGLVALYAWLEFPFANPAVVLTFCALFWCAVRYAQLDARTRTEAR